MHLLCMSKLGFAKQSKVKHYKQLGACACLGALARPRHARPARAPPAPRPRRRVRAPSARRPRAVAPRASQVFRMRLGRSVGDSRPAVRAMASLSAERQASEFEESATKRQRQDEQHSWVRFVATFPSTAMTVKQLKAWLRLGGAMSPAVAIDLPAAARGTKEKVKAAKKAVSLLCKEQTICVADRHIVLVRPGGANRGKKTMTEIENLINPIGPYQVSAEIFPIGKDTDLYTNTKSLFLGHFQSLGNSEKMGEGWSKICADGVNFHYKGTPAQQGTPAQLGGTNGAEETPGFILIIERPVVTFYFAVLPDVPLASHAGVLSVLRD